MPSYLNFLTYLLTLSLPEAWGHGLEPTHLCSPALWDVCVILVGERAKRARHYQGCTNSSCCGIYIYVWRYVCHISSACHAYVMWAELGHCHFLYVPAVLNVVTNGNGTGTKNVLKLNRAPGFEFSIQSSVKSKPILCWTWCTVSFYST